MTAVRVILFDVDGTLLRCGPQVRPIFAEAMVAVYGTTGDLDTYDFSGKTDQQIVLELLAGAGLEPAEARPPCPGCRRSIWSPSSAGWTARAWRSSRAWRISWGPSTAATTSPWAC